MKPYHWLTLSDLRKSFSAMLKPSLGMRLMYRLSGVRRENLVWDEKEVRQYLGIIDAMTLGEREMPATIDRSRTLRIARGSGMSSQAVHNLLLYHRLANEAAERAYRTTQSQTNR